LRGVHDPISYNLRNLASERRVDRAGLGLALVVFVVAAVLMLQKRGEGARSDAPPTRTGPSCCAGSDAELSSNIDEPSVGLVLATPGVARLENGNPTASAS